MTDIEQIIEKLTSSEWPPQAVIKAADITSRQLQHWTNKEYLSLDRDPKKWRKFSAKDIFAIQICSAFIRMGLPPNTLKYLVNEVKNSASFESAIRSHLNGNEIYLVTDLKNFTHIGPRINENDLLNKKPYTVFVTLRINRIIEDFLEIIHIQATPIDKETDVGLTEDEIALIDAVRNPEYAKIEVKKTAKNNKMTGTRYVTKDIQKEISKSKNCKVTTNSNENGKLTLAEITEPLTSNPSLNKYKFAPRKPRETNDNSINANN